MKALLRLFFSFSILLLPVVSTAAVKMEIQKIDDNIYALVGELDQRSPKNFANNSTHGIVVTDDGVILVDPGGSYKGGEQIHQYIKTITDKPIKYVINTGGQDHRWLGNSYFKALGAQIITSETALRDHKERTNYHFNRLDQLLGESLDGTTEVYADITFADKMELSLGGMNFVLMHAGPAHTPGDLFVWVPDNKVMFSGDIVFNNRALGPGPAQNVKSWIKVFDKMIAFDPKIIVPGHGFAAGPEKAKKDTYDYLVFLKESVESIIEDGGDVHDALKIDQSRFSYLKVFDRISKRNAQSVFNQMEFD